MILDLEAESSLSTGYVATGDRARVFRISVGAAACAQRYLIDIVLCDRNHTLGPLLRISPCPPDRTRIQMHDGQMAMNPKVNTAQRYV